MQTANKGAHSALAVSIKDEFRADLNALLLPSNTLSDIIIVWGTGYIRGTYRPMQAVSPGHRFLPRIGVPCR